MGIVVSHQLNGVLHRDIMLFHEVSDLQVHFLQVSDLSGLPPGVFSLLQGSFFPSRVPFVFGPVASLLVADEAFVVPHVFCSFTWGEVDLVYVHGIRVPGRLGSSSILGWQDITVSLTSKFPESYLVLVELSCLVEPLFPLPAGLVLSFWESGGSHHDSKLVGHPSLKGIYQDAFKVNSAVHLGQSEGGGILVKVTVELVHAKEVSHLAGSLG